MTTVKYAGLHLVALWVLAVAASAEAGQLSLINIDAPAVNCVFHASCVRVQ